LTVVGIGLVLSSRPVFRRLKRRRNRPLLVIATLVAVGSVGASYWAFVVKGWGIAEDAAVAKEQLALNYRPQISITWDHSILPPIHHLRINSRTRTTVHIHAFFYSRGVDPEVVDTGTVRMIAPNGFYAVDATIVYAAIERELASQQMARVPVFLWLKTEDGKEHTVRYLATGQKRTDGSIFVATQGLGISDGWVKS